jgi:hypothetical protein
VSTNNAIDLFRSMVGLSPEQSRSGPTTRVLPGPPMTRRSPRRQSSGPAGSAWKEAIACSVARACAGFHRQLWRVTANFGGSVAAALSAVAQMYRLREGKLCRKSGAKFAEASRVMKLRGFTPRPIGSPSRVFSLIALALIGGCETKRAESSGTSSAAPSTKTSPVKPGSSQAPVLSKGSSAAPASCSALCLRAASLGCTAAGACESTCGQMQALAVCKAELARFFECVAREPSDHWECDESGVPSIKEGYCEAEQAGFAKCVETRQ